MDASIPAGGLATFECQFGTSDPGSCSDRHTFIYYQLADDGLVSVLYHTHTCSARGVNEALTDRFGLNVSIIDDRSVLLEIKYVFYIHNVSMKDNGSVFSCSVVSSNQIQWQHNASLIVGPAINQEDGPTINQVDGPRLGRGGHVTGIAVGVGVAMVVAMASLIVISLLLCIRTRKKRIPNTLEADQGITTYNILI